MDLYLFDFDKTLYHYDFLQRLPSLSRASGVSQYDLASRWWAAGFEARAEAGEWQGAEAYLEKFAEVTGATLTLTQWQDARISAMTPIDGSIAALARVARTDRAALFSNNPSIFGESLPRLAPPVAEILGPNVLLSYQIHLRKPAPEAFERALEHFGFAAADTFFADDNAANIAGAQSIGIHAHHFTTVELLDTAIAAFAQRNQ